MRNGAIIAVGMAIAVGAAWRAEAQTYPDRVVQIIVPTTAGSSADILGRVLADGMSAQLGKPFIVVDKAGANGVLGSADVARAKPDGYTLMFTNISMAISPSLYPDLAYDPVKDFVSLGIAVFQPTMLVARPSFAGVPFSGFVEYLKSNGEKVAAAKVS